MSDLRTLTVAVAVAAFFCGAVTARAEERGGSLPEGHWEQRSDDGSRVCFDVLEHRQMRLTFFDAEAQGWKPILVEGRYRVTKAEKGNYQVQFTVDSVRRKGVSRCRKYVVDETLERTRQLGATMQHGTQLRLTLSFVCNAHTEHLQLCLDGGDGGKARVECRRLVSDEPRCSSVAPQRSSDELDPPPKPLPQQ